MHSCCVCLRKHCFHVFLDQLEVSTNAAQDNEPGSALAAVSQAEHHSAHHGLAGESSALRRQREEQSWQTSLPIGPELRL